MSCCVAVIFLLFTAAIRFFFHAITIFPVIKARASKQLWIESYKIRSVQTRLSLKYKNYGSFLMCCLFVIKSFTKWLILHITVKMQLLFFNGFLFHCHSTISQGFWHGLWSQNPQKGDDNSSFKKKRFYIRANAVFFLQLLPSRLVSFNIFCMKVICNSWDSFIEEKV